jgi:cell division protein FtsI/penicillin-binding protein 2
MPHARLASWLLAPCIGLFAVLALPWPLASARTQPDNTVDPERSVDTQGVGAPSDKVEAAPPTAAQPLISAMTYDAGMDRYVAAAGPSRAVLSVSPRIQRGLEKLLSDYRVPVGAAVLLEPGTGRVIAMAEHAERDQGPGVHVALQPIAPAASVFKIVTSAALLEKGITPDSEVCFHGGKHRIQPALLTDNPRRDRRCLTLASALGKSANVVFAKLAGRDLSAEGLQAEADRFMFNAPIPFAWPVEPSTARMTDDPFDFAITAAGFGEVRMSPLHGALIAAMVANGGRFVPPRIVDELDGNALPPPAQPRDVLQPEVAAALARMMRTTVTEGTARKIFRRDRNSRRSPLREVTVAGKTGSLAETEPYRDYSWFVGFAPVENPQIAVAVAIVNQRLWRVKASFVAHEALKAYFAEENAKPVRTAQR